MWTLRPEEHEWHLGRLEESRFRVERFLLMPKHEAWLRREAFVRQAYSSTMIENPHIPEAELTRAESELTIERPDVANYARALEFVDFLSTDPISPIDERVIRQIHWFLMRGTRDDHFLPGEYRRSTNWIEDNGVKVYEPPYQADVAPYMREFILALRDSELHPVLKAGLAHVHLVAIHPFVDGNGRTARLLATLILQASGWGFKNLLSLDSYYQGNRDGYIRALASTLGSKYPQQYDATSWLNFFCLGMVVQTGLLESRLTEWQMMVEKLHRDLRPSGLLDRQVDGLVYALRSGTITRRDYMEITGVSGLTATRDLAVLTAKGHLIPKGVGRGRVYRTTAERPTSGIKKEEGIQQPKLL